MRSAFPYSLVALGALALSACGGHKDAANTAAAAAKQPDMPAGLTPAAASKPALTLADGPNGCFRAIAKQIGADTKVSEVSAFYSAGKDIDSNAYGQKGQLMICSAKYQSPTDPRKLVEVSMNQTTGAFDPPRPVEITVMGGDEAAFKLDDYLIPLSKVNAAGLTTVMDAQKAKLDSYYSSYAWSGVRLEAPDAFSSTHTLRLDIVGRLKSNDVKKDGYASVTVDGKKVTKDFLTS